ncbi:hypothetical protein F4802DRAFT_550828 [Xylaria palmicola]|nr:hypothetical protein F4802DRAFT_550828 [Xylaria palmicola]
MLATRDQENLAASHQHGAAAKQQQGQAGRALAPKTPGAKFSKTPMKIPLNDENGARAMTSKAFKGGDKSDFITPMTQRARAVLGDKTTNAKAKGLQTVNVKSAIREIEQSQVKPKNTVRPKPREIQAETQKLQVHAEEADPLSEDEIEYCPPKPMDLPYESDVFPEGVLNFDALKPENMMKGYYQYYFNPLDERGVSQRDKELREAAKNAIGEGEKEIQQELNRFGWRAQPKRETDARTVKKASSSATKQPAPRRPLSTVRSRSAADALTMDDTTKSMQRKAAPPPCVRKPVYKKSSSFVTALRTRRPGSSQLPSAPKKSASELEATSRTTIGYNRGRATASLLSRTTTPTMPTENRSASASASTRRGGLPRSDTTLSNDSDKTITPARYAHKQAAASDDGAWRERVPFLAIFDPDTHDEDDGSPATETERPVSLYSSDGESFELKLLD